MTKQKTFVKKPIRVHAVQWKTVGDHPDVIDAVKAIKGSADAATFLAGKGWLPDANGGGRIVTPGDWIVTGIDGEVYPLSVEAFEAHYDPA